MVRKRPENFSKTYTEKEKEVIYSMSSFATVEAIAARLKRPVEGVRVLQIELGCADMHIESGMYSANALGQLTGVSYEKVRRWIREGLPASKRAKHKGVDEKNMSYFIDPVKFWKWAREHKHRVQFSDIERQTILPEPDWVEAERTREIKEGLDKRGLVRKFTPAEDAKLWRLYMEGQKQKAIAEEMNRPLSSIEKRLQKLRKERF